jgi:hypothetical protein
VFLVILLGLGQGLKRFAVAPLVTRAPLFSGPGCRAQGSGDHI